MIQVGFRSDSHGRVRSLPVVAFIALLACSINPATTPADEILFADFESEQYVDWVSEGQAFGTGPASGALPNQMRVSDFAGVRLVNSYLDGDKSTGSLTSTAFTINHDYISFLIGGGRLNDEVGIELLIAGERQRYATGTESEGLSWKSWDVRDLMGQRASLRIFDNASGGWGHILIDQVTFGDASKETPVVGRMDFYRHTPHYYHEPSRPQFHFTPEMNWMNDPNGLVWHDGEFHLFYQHNPHANEWGHMSWGHAVSNDLLHWKHLPIAIHDEYGVMAFSGSAVSDAKNSSGFGINGNSPLVAIYTGHGFGQQTQDLAFSNDRGRTWMKHSGNPVLDLNKKDFRDPKVFWHKPTSKWIMVVSLAAEKRLQIYGSADLKKWNLLSEFGPAGVRDKPNWECPDLFELPVENEPGKTRWVLEADMGSGSIAGGSGGEYFIGSFDGVTFIPDSLESQWVDYGRDFYAPVSWSNVPESDGRRLWIGWMNNWETCLNPTYPWRSAMSIPRELTLRRIDGKLQMCQRPVSEVGALRSDTSEITNRSLDSSGWVLPTTGQQLDIILEIDPGDASQIGLHVLKGKNQQTTIGYDVARQQVFVDRTRSGKVDWHPAFPGRHAGPLKMIEGESIILRILVDACPVEVFGNHGETVITDLVFPDASSDAVELFSVGGSAQIRNLSVSKLRSVWP